MTQTNTSETRETQSKLMRLLIVEDTPEHMERAREFFNTKTSEVSVDYASTLKEAIDYLNSGQYNGILTDMFYPSGEIEGKDKKLREKLAGKITRIYFGGKSSVGELNEKNPSVAAQKGLVKEWKEGRKLAPMGALLGNRALKMKIPLLVVTDMNHHGRDYEPLHQMTTYDGWKPSPFSDAPVVEQIGCRMRRRYFIPIGSERKDWSKGYESLLNYILRK